MTLSAKWHREQNRKRAYRWLCFELGRVKRWYLYWGRN